MAQLEGPILILVDDDDVRLLCVDTIARQGLRTVTARDTADALAFIEYEEPELSIIELRSGVEDRMALLSALSRRASRPSPPILALVDASATELRVGARKAGVTDFLTKPIDAIEIDSRARSMIELQRLRAVSDSLRTDAERCHSIIDSLAEGVALVDDQDRLAVVNPMAAQIMGYTVDEMKGRLVFDLARDECGKKLMREEFQRLREGLAQRAEYELVRKDGTSVWVVTTATPLYEGGRYIGAAGTGLDITLRHSAEEALRRSESRLSLAIAAGNLGLWDWDLVTDTAYLSPEYMQSIGLDESQVPFARDWFTDRIHPDERESVWKTLDETLQGRTLHSSIEYRARHESGEYVWLRGLGQVVGRDRAGAPTRMIGVTVAITEQKRTEEQLRAAIVTRDSVLAVASHDLRNPLSAIHLSTTLLTARPADRERRKSRKQLDTILRSATFMRRLIDQLLDAATIEAGTFTLSCARVELQPLLDELFEEFQPLAARRRIQIIRHALASLPPVWCDAVRVREVLSNLIGNALKFVPDGGFIGVRVWRDGSDVHFEVSDNGPGISSAALEHLFQRFWTGSREGKGLGLYISKAIVEAHHGHISAESKLGAGSTFRFSIPVVADQQDLHSALHV
jgi:PAS domain S-box-containing protein